MLSKETRHPVAVCFGDSSGLFYLFHNTTVHQMSGKRRRRSGAACLLNGNSYLNYYQLHFTKPAKNVIITK